MVSSLTYFSFFAPLLLFIGGDAQTIVLTINTPGILSGEKLCSSTIVTFTCTAINVQVVKWFINGTERTAFTSLDMPPINRQIDRLTAYLNSSDNDGQFNVNVTSTLLGTASDFQNVEQIACLGRDTTEDTNQDLNFTLIASTPAPKGYVAFVDKSNMDDTLYFDLQWDSAFSETNRIDTYRLEASNEFIDCPQMCSPSGEPPCRCSGLTAGMDGSINIIATSCGNLQGPPAVINIMPRVPMGIPSCSSYPVYNASDRLYMIETIWNTTGVMNLSQLAPGVSQDVSVYSVSVNDDTALTMCSNMCSYSYNVQSSSSSFTVRLAAGNIFGFGPERNCNLPSNGNISPTNDVFSIVLSTTTSNRTVECTQDQQSQGIFSCQFCINLPNNSATCYNLEDNDEQNAANTALSDLVSGTYYYRATAVINQAPVGSIYDFFSTSCQPDELGTSGDPVNSTCLTILNGVACYDGTAGGSVATYTCNNGFMLTGSAERMCRNDGRWEGDIPSCDAIAPPWVTPLLAIGVIFCVICIIAAIISIALSCYLCKGSKSLKNKKLLIAYVVLIVELVLFIPILGLWVGYAADPNSVDGRNSVIAAFVFSVLLGLSLVVTLIIVFVLKTSTGYAVREDNEISRETSTGYTVRDDNEISHETSTGYTVREDDELSRENTHKIVKQ